MSDDLQRTWIGDPPTDRGPILGVPKADLDAMHARIAQLEAERDAAQAIAQDMRSKAFAATNPANWQKGDCSDAAMLKHFAETLDEIARANDYDILERTMRAVFKYSVEPLQARADAAEAKLREAADIVRGASDLLIDGKPNTALEQLAFALARLTGETQGGGDDE